jgi:hypothetical protein
MSPGAYIFRDNIFNFTNCKCILLVLYNNIFNAWDVNNMRSGDL